MLRTCLRAAGLMAALGLAACETALEPVDPVPVPPARPDRPVSSPERATRSAESLRLEDYYARVQRSLVAQGLLRRDAGGPDTPVDQRRLVDNFIRIALFEEYARIGSRLVARPTESRLHRWERPVTLELEFGETVPEARQSRDRRVFSNYVARLRQVTDHPIRQVETGGNFNVFIVNEDERRALGPRLRALIPGISASAIETVLNMQRSNYCLVFALDPRDNGAYSQAVAVIRAEHPNLMRLSCIHEEIAQGLGLSNDSPSARPSIFNDDEEFALLTTHDEMLLKILYDERLRPGMNAAEARPIATEIAGELLGGES